MKRRKKKKKKKKSEVLGNCSFRYCKGERRGECGHRGREGSSDLTKEEKSEGFKGQLKKFHLKRWGEKEGKNAKRGLLGQRGRRL